MLDDLKMFARYGFGLREFLRHPLTSDECHRSIERQLRLRGESFLRILGKGVFANRRSPYRQLLAHARIEFDNIAKWVRQEGVESSLERMYEAGVYVTLDEFKGREPIRRPGLEFAVRPKDFDNPLLARQYEGSTGGSRGAGTRVIIDFDLLAYEAAYLDLFLTAFALRNRPAGVWMSIPPAVAGIKNVLRAAKLGTPPAKWFTQNRWAFGPRNLKHSLLLGYAIYGSRLFGKPLPVPEYMPLEEAATVARWLAERKREGTPALFETNPSSGVRVCLAAGELGLDIAGTLFRFGSEPYTAPKAKLVSEAGCRAAPLYAMAEVGRIGIPCAAPRALDDVHLVIDKLAVIQRNTEVGDSGVSIGAFYYTTLLPSCPKLMLNVASGDYGVLEDRDCGCHVGEIGLNRHLHTIRSYDKLTSEGMTFLGSELMALVDEILPGRFGGHATDYQFVEEEEGGLSKVSIIASPRLGELNEEQVVTTVLSVLSSNVGYKKMMADRWRTGQTLRLIRREPYLTNAAKILPLHILHRSS